MTCGIYSIKCTGNDKVYIGQSVNIENRWRQHRKELDNNTHVNKDLQEDWNKYERDQFCFMILKEDEEEYLNALEKHFIDAFDSNKKGYNKRIEKGAIKKKHKGLYNGEIDRIDMLDTIVLKLNKKELAIMLTFHILFNIEETYGTFTNKHTLKDMSDITSNDCDMIINNTMLWDSSCIILEEIEKQIQEQVKGVCNIDNVYYATQEDYVLEGDKTTECGKYGGSLRESGALNTLMKTGKLPIAITYLHDGKVKEKYLMATIEDSDAIISTALLHNRQVEKQISAKQRELDQLKQQLL